MQTTTGDRQTPLSMMAIFRILTPAELEALHRPQPDTADLAYEEDSATLDIEKAWDGIGFLLRHCPGAPSDVEVAIYGGDPVGDDLGYGPARLLSPSEVKRLAEALARVGAEALTQGFDANAMRRDGVYPAIWDREGSVEYLLEYWPLLVEHYQRAASQDAAMLLALI